MIEIIYREDDNRGEEISVRLPKNIKQIGDTNGNKKVYFEEQVINMLKEKPSYGVLLGKVKRVSNCSYVFINGAVIANGDKRNIDFGDKVWTGIYEDIHSYYSSLEIVGWYASEETKNISLETTKKIQLDNFPGNDRICILSDLSENDENLYHYNNGAMENLGGYYVYFEKNPEFKRYMTRVKALDELFSGEAKAEDEGVKETEDIPEKKYNFKGMIPSYMVIALLLAIIVVMNNYSQISSIKARLSDIAGNLVNTKVTQADTTMVQPVIENLPGEVETTTPKETTTKAEKKTEESTTKPKKKEEESTTKADVQPVVEPKYYTVKKGETLSDISRKIYNNLTMVEDIMKVNKIKDQNLILEGQKIILP